MTYNFTVASNVLVVTLNTESGLYQPRIVNYLKPSVEIANNGVYLKNYDLGEQKFAFGDFGTINGIVPTDINDAYSKLLVLVSAVIELTSLKVTGALGFTPTSLPVTNATTTALSLSQLNTAYPAASLGFKVHCISISAGALIYEKTSAGWCSYAVAITI